MCGGGGGMGGAASASACVRAYVCVTSKATESWKWFGSNIF